MGRLQRHGEVWAGEEGPVAPRAGPGLLASLCLRTASSLRWAGLAREGWSCALLKPRQVRLRELVPPKGRRCQEEQSDLLYLTTLPEM